MSYPNVGRLHALKDYVSRPIQLQSRVDPLVSYSKTTESPEPSDFPKWGLSSEQNT
jgi:hypothetical protein